jgi:hypothetical protein
VLGKVDDWLTGLFALDGIDATVTRLAEQAERPEDPATQAKKVAAGAEIRTTTGQHRRAAARSPLSSRRSVNSHG